MTLVAVPSSITESGQISYWALSGETNRTALCKALEGILPAPLFPAEISPEAALTRTVQSLTERGVTAYATRSPRGWALIERRETPDPNGATTAEGLPLSVISTHEILRCGLADDGHLWTHITDEQRAADLLPAGGLAARFEAQLDTLATTDVSMWLTRVLRSLHAVSLRSSGGFYFLPRGLSLVAWAQLTNVVNGTTEHRVYGIAAMADTQAAVAVLDALRQEVAAHAAHVQGLVDEGAAGGSRAIGRKISDLTEIHAKIRTYEELFSTQLGELHGSLDSLAASLTVAQLTQLATAAE